MQSGYYLATGIPLQLYAITAETEMRLSGFSQRMEFWRCTTRRALGGATSILYFLCSLFPTPCLYTAGRTGFFWLGSIPPACISD
jgi:hypothetical protein